MSDYKKCSKFFNTSYLPKRPRQTGQTQMRLLLKKQSDQVFHVCYSDKHFVISSPETNLLFQNRKRKVFEIKEIYCECCIFVLFRELTQTSLFYRLATISFKENMKILWGHVCCLRTNLNLNLVYTISVTRMLNYVFIGLDKQNFCA